jgi:hypothetical protein
VRGKEPKRALRRRQLLWGIAWRTPLCHGPTAMPGRRNPCAWHYFSCTDRRVVLRKSDLTEQRSSRLPSRHLLGRRSPRRPAGSRSPGELPDARTSQQKARPAPQLGVRGTPPAQCGINLSAVLGDSQSYMSPGSRSAPAIMAGAAAQTHSMRLAGPALRSALQPHLLEQVGESRVTGGGLKRSELVEQHAQIGIALRTCLLRPGRVPSCPQGHVHPE